MSNYLHLKMKVNPIVITELSDGERNAILICADILTAQPNHLIILDEPERHLHRSISSPLLSSLFQKRPDCFFVISTHDISLPIDHAESSILLLRSCQWLNKEITNWDADLIPNTNMIPHDLKYNILGSKRKILFVEGTNNSLDKQIYQILFPNISVILLGNCKQVEKAVTGIKETEELHWIDAYGLIDADNRTSKDIDKLLSNKIAVSECYSVESLYYHPKIIMKIAERQSKSTENDPNKLYQKATSKIIENVELHKSKLCSRLCVKKARELIMANLPKDKHFEQQEEFMYSYPNIKDLITAEEAIFDTLINANNFDGLINRYPVRETQTLSNIAMGLGLTKNDYENHVRQLINDDVEASNICKNLLVKLTELITDPQIEKAK